MTRTYIHIGMPKAGSTSIQKFLELHPDIYYNWSDTSNFPINGEINEEICNKGLDASVRVFSEECFATPVAGIADRIKVRIEDTSIHLHQKNTAIRLKTLLPDAKIVLVLRAYEEIPASLYSQMLVSGAYFNKTKFIQLFGHKLIQYYNYDFLVDLYTQLFGKENVIILPFEKLKAGNDAFLTNLSTIFNVEKIALSLAKENSSITQNNLAKVRLRNYLKSRLYIVIPKKYRLHYAEKWRANNKVLKNKFWSKGSKKIEFKGTKGFKELIQEFKRNNPNIRNLEDFKPFIDNY